MDSAVPEVPPDSPGDSAEREFIVREILKLLPEIARALSRGTPSHSRMGGISMAQVKAMVHLAQYGEQTMGELAEGLRISMASATGLVDPLVESGHVNRGRDPYDRRVVRVRLSPEAQDLADRILRERRVEVEKALEGMDLGACAHFLEGLNRLAAVYGCRGSAGEDETRPSRARATMEGIR